MKKQPISYSRLLIILLLCNTISVSAQNPAKITSQNVIISSDDIEMHAVLYRSSPTGEPRPAIILVHGWMPYDAEAQWDVGSAKRIASHGYTTLAITMRGWPKTGGVDDCGWKQPYDLVNAINWLANQEGIDPNRIGLLGASQGGQVSLFAASLENSVKVKAVAAYFPVIDVAPWLATSDLGERIINRLTERCSEGVSMEERSPIYRADKIDASVLLIHGDQDTNIQIGESEKMLKALVDNGADTQLYVVEGGTHHYDGSPKWEKSFLKMMVFFEEKL